MSFATAAGSCSRPEARTVGAAWHQGSHDTCISLCMVMLASWHVATVCSSGWCHVSAGGRERARMYGLGLIDFPWQPYRDSFAWLILPPSPGSLGCCNLTGSTVGQKAADMHGNARGLAGGNQQGVGRKWARVRAPPLCFLDACSPAGSSSFHAGFLHTLSLGIAPASTRTAFPAPHALRSSRLLAPKHPTTCLAPPSAVPAASRYST